MSSPGLPPDSSAGSPTGGDPGRRWLRRKDTGPSLEELEARIAEQTAAAERFATLRAAAEKAATEPPRTHCIEGHPFDEDNTYINPTTGRRQCKTCRRKSSARHRARKSAA